MNQKCVSTIDKLSQTFAGLADALDELKTAIALDSDDKVDMALDMFPTPKNLTSALEKLGALIEGHPWENKRRKQ
jgi:hypothetical protein